MRWWRDLIRLLSTRWKLARLMGSARVASACGVAVTVVSALVAPAQAVVTGLVVASAVAAASPTENDAAVGLAGALVVFAVVQVVQQFAESVRATALMMMSRGIDAAQRGALRSWVSGQMTTTRLESPSVQDTLRTAAGANNVSLGAATVAQLSWVAGWITTIGAGLVVAALSWWAALAAVVVNTIALSVQRRLRDREVAAWLETVPVQRQGQYVAELADAAAKDLRIFGWQRFLLARRKQLWHVTHDRQTTVWRRLGLVGAAVIGVQWAVFTALALVAVTAAFSGRIGPGAAVAFVLAAEVLVFRPPPEGSIHAAQATLTARLALAQHDTTAPPAPAPAPVIGNGDRARSDVLVELVDVGFRYPHATSPVFDGLNLRLRRGESVAIVGINGAGKTTLIKLLCGLYLPSAGQILVNGQPLDQHTVDAWRQRLAVVFQDYCRYPLTLRDNVAVGRDGHEEDALAWSASAEGTGLHDVLARLPHGWDTVLSKQFDHGVELSGGQWQRVVLARALYATQAGADVVILDEPTANLDVRSELRVFDAVLDHTQQQTTILVSHRLSTVRRVDRIVVLDEGRVVEDGSHDSLMARGGMYREMFRAQAAGFDPDDESGQEAMLDA